MLFLFKSMAGADLSERYSHAELRFIAMRSLVFLAALLVTAASSAESVNFPQSYPIPMTFRAFDKLKPDTPAFQKRLNDLNYFPIIHGLGSDEKIRSVSERWPNKIATIQAAYGGVFEKDFSEVWPGHWLYKAGTLLAENISPQDNFIRVEQKGRITKNPKHISKSNKAFPFGLVIYALDESGKPDWSHAEHVILDAMDKSKLKIQRGQWGSKPLSFKAGKAVVAAHMMFWTKQWQLNFGLHSPRGGPSNLTAAEWFARKSAQRLPELKADGIEFDVGRWTWGHPENNPMDVNNDLVPDYGYIDGVNSFGLGGQVFLRELRKVLGPNKIIQVDSHNAIFGVRGWRYLNGVQIEAFPAANDFDRFSEIFWHLRLWSENAEGQPRFSYPFTKTPTTTFAHVRLAGGKSADFRFRVGLAAAAMVGMPHLFASLSNDNYDPANFSPSGQKKADESYGIYNWDEYHGGDLNKWQWLGKPIAAAKQDFSDMDKTDLLANASWQWKTASGFDAANAQTKGVFSANVQHIPAGVLPKELWFGVRLEPKGGGVKTLMPGREYTLEFDARGSDSWHYAGQDFERVPRMLTIRGPFASKSKKEKPLSVLADSTWRTYKISFIADASATPGPVFGVSEQIGSTDIRNIKLYAGGSERWSREFENGLVLLNMTSRPWHVALPKNVYKRLKGQQAPDVNTGQPVESAIDVPPQDAVFLMKR